MEFQYQRLKERTEALGNHNRKYLASINRNKDALISKLEKAGKIDQVHLWRKAYNFSEEMETILSIGESQEEKLEFLGCYFAFQFLHMNLSAVDVLMLDLTSKVNELEVYRQFILQVGRTFRALTSTYISNLLNLFFSDDYRPEFAIISVGTRSDQDDIDVGIIDNGSAGRAELNRAVGHLGGEMFKRAVCMHFHLSEHVGTEGYSASIEEYNEMLNKEIHDFVIITEMLGAARLFGSRRLVNRFRREITGRYFYKEGHDNKFHEGYLRGILGEVRSFMLREVKKDSINPKEDALRMIKAALYAGKTVFGLRQVNYWSILRELKYYDLQHTHLYEELDRVLTFMEIFRNLYQLFVVQEEETYLDDPIAYENIETVAKAMGYKRVGVVRAADFLLTDYYENIHAAKNTLKELIPPISVHLERIAIFSRLTTRKQIYDPVIDFEGNLAVDFIKLAGFFRGTKFWDDVLAQFEKDDARLLIHFIRDICSLSKERQNEIVEQYAKWGQSTFFAFMTFLVTLHRHRDKFEKFCTFKEMNEAFFRRVHGYPDEVRRLTAVFTHYPHLVNTYLSILPEDKQRTFAKWLESATVGAEIVAARDKLLHLIKLHYATSMYFQRFFHSVVDKNPEYIAYLNDPNTLSQIAKGILGETERLASFGPKLEKLGLYYDLEFLCVGIEAIQGKPFTAINAEFTEFSDTYLSSLFDICKQQLDEEIGTKVATKDLLAIYAAGGHGCERAFDDDYDLIILLDSPDNAVLQYACKIITRMNTQIIRRGTLPHYRFVDHFGRYVTTVDELHEHFTYNQDSSLFIDKSQILGSRMIVGSKLFANSFEERIIKPHIFDKKEEYVRAMINEINSRHNQDRLLEKPEMNIKEGRGGLRDVEMLLLVYKAYFGLRDPINIQIVETLARLIPERSEQLKNLAESFDKLRYLRDLYRLTASAEDHLDPEHLRPAAEIVGYTDTIECSAVSKLVHEMQKRMSSVADTVDILTEDLMETM